MSRERQPASTLDRTVSRRAALAAFGAGALAVALSACGSDGGGSQPERPALGPPGGFPARFPAYEPADEPNGDLARVTWPDWLVQFDPEVKRLYEFQVVNGDLMRWMPCFCGCHRGDGHRNNRDCYVEAVNLDGSVVFDSMAPT